MKRIMERILLLTVLGSAIAASSCASGGYTVGYGYTGTDPYGDVFYSSPMDRYGYGFYGHP